MLFRSLHPRLGRVRRTQESSKLSPQHHHRRGFVGPRYVPPIMRHEVNRQRYLGLHRILLVLASMAISHRLQTGIVRPNPFPILIYGHLVVVLFLEATQEVENALKLMGGPEGVSPPVRGISKRGETAIHTAYRSSLVASFFVRRTIS